jgi:Kef-type K+ transport system membrane component KefB
MSLRSNVSPVSSPPPPARVSWQRQAAGYLVCAILPAVAALFVIRNLAGGPARPPATPARVASALPVYQVLLAIAVIVVAAHLLAALAEKLRQPRVIGELAAGLLLGPSVFGVLAPELAHRLWTPDLVAFLATLAQLGLVFFMFLVGRELPFALLRGSGGRALVAGHSAIALPFLAGVGLSVTVLARYRPASVSPLAFTLFCGIAFSITAFPVLARVLTDRKLRNTRIGALGMATAGIADVSAWCVLAVVVAVAHGRSGTEALRTIALTVGFGAIMWWVVRPVLARLADRAERGSADGGWLMIVLLVVLLASAAATQAIGVQAIFGAFMAGLAAPRSRLVEQFADRLTGPTDWLLMPIFFAITGIQVSLAALAVGANWAVIGVVIVVAMSTKFVGAAAPAALSGLDARTSAGLGVMMTCRGMTELIVLQLGLSLGIIPPNLFVLFLVMALVTTALTGPLLTWLYPRGDTS